MIALLGLAQIPLGLTLYGSPVALFVLYALAVFALLVIYFVLSHVREKHGGYGYGSDYSYGTGSVVDDRREHSRLGTLAKAGAAGAGLAALSNRFRRRSGNDDRPEVVGSRRHSGSYVEEEKYSQYGRDPGREGKWTDRLLKIGAIGGAVAVAKNLLDRRRDRDLDHDSDTGHYGPPLGGATEITEENFEGRSRPPPSRHHPLDQPLHHRRSTSSISYDSYMSASGANRRGHGIRDTVLGLGAFGLARNIINKRRERKEQKRVDALKRQDEEADHVARENSQRNRNGVRRGSTSSMDYSVSTDDRPRYDQGRPPPMPAGPILGGVGGGSAGATLADRDRQHTQLGAQNPVLAGAPPGPPVVMPPVPPDHQGIIHQDSGSEAYVSAGGRQHRRRSNRGAAAAGLAGGAAGLAAAEALSSRRDRRHSTSRDGRHSNEGSMASPPVSVKVKMHSDGRHVTLRRLPEEEAAAEREARRRERHERRRRGGSGSTLSGTDGGNERFRRVEAMERQQAEEMRRERGQQQQQQQQQFAQPQAQAPIPVQPAQPMYPTNTLPVPLPPPPPIPSSSTPLGPPRPGTGGTGGTPGSVGSPGTYDGTATEASAEYANNRRRRRAERAQAKQARSGNRVEFE